MAVQGKNTNPKNQGDEGASAPASAALQAVLDHQDRLQHLEREVLRLKEIKASRQAQIAKVDELQGQLSTLQARAEDLMADIESGEDRAADLERVREQVRQASDRLGDAGFDDADAVLAGLDRKIEREEASLKELRAQHPRLVCQLLMHEAETCGAEYAEAALKTISLWHRLHAINRMLIEHGRGSSFAGNAELKVPSFSLESVLPHAHFNFKEFIRVGNDTYGHERHLHLAERERIKGMGVNLAPQEA